MHTLLWVTPKWPLPPFDGARQASCNLLRSLTHSGTRIDLAAVVGPDETIDSEEARKALGIRQVWILPRHRIRHSLLSRLLRVARNTVVAPRTPITLTDFCRPSIQAGLSAVAGEGTRQAKSWDAVVYDGLHPAAHLICQGVYRKGVHLPAIIYRAHNREAQLWRRAAEKARNVFTRGFLKYQAGLVKNFEDSLLRAAAGVAAVSEDDLDFFRKEVPTILGRVVRIGYDFALAPLPLPRENPAVLFLGRLDWQPNREGLMWLLERVWPQVNARRPDLMLIVAGSGGDSGLVSRLNSALKCRYFGAVSRVDTLYEQSLVSLVPVFVGSGTRVKAIEAARFGRGCISTALGVEGLTLEAGSSYLRAETADEWINTLCSIDVHTASRLGLAAFDRMRGEFSAEKAADSFQVLLREALVGGKKSTVEAGV